LDISPLIDYTRVCGEADPTQEDVVIQIAFTEAEIAALEYERYRHPSPHVQKRMEVVYLKSHGMPHQEIARLCRISRQTVVTILHLYQQDGIERLKRFHFAGQPSALNQHQSTLEAPFRAHPPRTVAEAQATIEHLTNIRRSPTQIRAFLTRIGMQVRKVGTMPGRAHEEQKQQEQDTFQQAELEPRLDEVRQGTRTLFLSMPPTASTVPS
jgi:transposase